MAGKPERLNAHRPTGAHTKHNTTDMNTLAPQGFTAQRSRRQQRLAWHYTSGIRLESILREGRIRLEIGPVIGKERPAVWFTTSEVFEPTAFAAVQRPDGSVHQITSAEEQARLAGGLIRIGVEPNRLHSYSTWSERSGCPAVMQRSLERIALDGGSNPQRDWLVAFKPVKASAWVAIEQSTDGVTWAPAQPDQEVG